MTSKEIARCRLANQLIAGSKCTSPGEAVAAMGALQAQDYLSSLWAVGLRVRNATEQDVENAISGRQIIRTWPLRGTLHFVAPHDIRWMLKHLAPRMVAAAAGRHRELELDEATFARSAKIFTRALQGGKVLTRPEMMELLERAKIVTANQRGYHILWKLALAGLLCCGPRKGKQQTFVLLDEWLPKTSRIPSCEEALADFALRYFTSHGPATLEDFAWWIGMKKSDAQAALDSITPHLSRVTSDGRTFWLNSAMPSASTGSAGLHLLPSFDELLLGYTDRSNSLAPAHAQHIAPGSNGMFMPVIVTGGRVVGTWKRTLKKSSVSLGSTAFTSFGKTELRAWSTAAKRYAAFLGTDLLLE